MANGWETLGNVLGGGVNRGDAYDSGRLRSAQTEEALIRARQRQLDLIAEDKRQRAMDGLQQKLADAGHPNSELTYGLMSAGGGNAANLTDALLGTQEYNFRGVAGNPETPNSARQAALGAVQGKPYSPFEAVGSGGYTDITVDAPSVMNTPLGESLIDENIAQAGAADALAGLRTAQTNNPAAFRASGGGTAGAPGKPPSGYIANPNFDPSKPVGDGNYPYLDAREPTMGSRERTFFRRVVGGAKNAQNTIQNLMDLPVGASGGIFGIGEQPGTSIFSAGIDTLRNTVATQDVQTYNTMLAGLNANLAQVEGHGLATSNAFQGQYDRLALREGDTELTRLHKLAEMAQTITSGLDPYLSDPAIPAEQKAYIQELLTTLNKTIPFTHADVFALEKNPGMTLGQLVESRGLNQGSLSGAAQAAGGGPTAPAALPPRNDKGWALMEDAAGNKAYVGPNGEIEEVQ